MTQEPRARMEKKSNSPLILRPPSRRGLLPLISGRIFPATFRFPFAQNSQKNSLGCNAKELFGIPKKKHKTLFIISRSLHRRASLPNIYAFLSSSSLPSPLPVAVQLSHSPLSTSSEDNRRRRNANTEDTNQLRVSKE